MARSRGLNCFPKAPYCLERTRVPVSRAVIGTWNREFLSCELFQFAHSGIPLCFSLAFP